MKIDGRGGQPASTGRAGAGPAGYQALQIAQRGEQALGQILFTYPSSRGILLETRTGGSAMARTTAELPQGTRITDYVSLGVIARTVPLTKVHGALPAHVVVYYVIALALYMQSSCREVLRCLLEGIQ